MNAHGFQGKKDGKAAKTGKKKGKQDARRLGKEGRHEEGQEGEAGLQDECKKMNARC